MATRGVTLDRRQWLAAAMGAMLVPASAGAKPAGAPHSTTLSSDVPQLAAAWQAGADQHIGLLSLRRTGTVAVNQSLSVPTRAHGLWVQADGAVLAVARRPGDWLLRWQPATQQTQWYWATSDRRFNGHVVSSPNGAQLWCSQTDVVSGQGLVAVLDAKQLRVVDEWPTHGVDPHALCVLPQALGVLPAGTLMVANGGIPTWPETGRSKRLLHHMDSSLVAIEPTTGALLGQWRLPDQWLSLRHLAWNARPGVLGVAIQAELAVSEPKESAPVLAVFDGKNLTAAFEQPALSGYGGDIGALPAAWGGVFMVSCPRANCVAMFDANGRWLRNVLHSSAYAIASNPQQWWLASSAVGEGVLQAGVAMREISPVVHTQNLEPSLKSFAWASTASSPPLPLQLDNHWQLYR